jgi:hypothetical protein
MDAMNNKLRIAGKSLLSRLTGLSTPFVGVQWTPPVDEKDRAHRLLLFLSDRRALFDPFNVETEILVTMSVQEIRKRLVSDLELVKPGCPLGDSLSALAGACRKFLADTRSDGGDHAPHHYRRYGEERAEFFRSLGELRAFFGVYITVLAAIYGLTVEGELTTILPPEPMAASKKRKGDAS